MTSTAKTEKKIFKNGSTTYYFSSIFFPTSKRTDVFKLYSFVRVIDDYVDSVPPNLAAFSEAQRCWNSSTAKSRDATQEIILTNILQLEKKYRLDRDWTASFLASMTMDVNKRHYKTLDESLDYVYGSAEVIGLYMARILELPKEAEESAKLQGRAMQWINFIRDIAEDNALKRQYFPDESLNKHGLKDLSEATCKNNPSAFTEFLNEQINTYKEWQKQAEDGYKYIPKRYRIPIRTAADMYMWTANIISKDPLVIFQKKVKPSKYRVFYTVIKRTIYG